MPIRFRKQCISAEAFEAAGVWDVDGDGQLDIVSGGFWYRGPSFWQKFRICDVNRAGEYYDDFSVLPVDLDGSGHLSILTGGWWSDCLRLRKRPNDPTQEWVEEKLFPGIGNIETMRTWDVDGDGQLEFVPNTPGHPFCFYKWRSAEGRFSQHLISEKPIGHGYGFGDIDSDGIGEFVFRNGYLKHAGDPFAGAWTHHESFDLGLWDASCPILVEDVDGDGVAEMIVGHGHSYGLDLWKFERGNWRIRSIDPFCAQYHELQWADIDGDGECELVTGKRHRAHDGHEAGEEDSLGIYVFKWTGDCFAKQVIDFVAPGGSGGGCGIQFALADFNGNGLLDLVAPGKDGLYVYWNESS